MEKEKILEFTRRITQSNKSGLTLITYEILFVYLEDAKIALKDENHIQFKQNVQDASKCISRLINTLDFHYGLSKELFPIYQYCKEQLAMSLIKNESKEIEIVNDIMKQLYESFHEVAKKDLSLPIMQNSEKVFAGMTYQKNNLTENYNVGTENRGFLV